MSEQLNEQERKQYLKNIKYWGNRNAIAQDAVSRKNVAHIEKQLSKYYESSMQKIIGQFEQTYNKVFSSIEKGREPTPADLYKLDSYWKLQGQMRAELQKLGNKQAVLFSKQFEKQWLEIYNSISLPSQQAFSTVSTEMVQQMINQIWTADGQSWSNRIWGNTERLMEELNGELIHCVVAGKKTTDLKHILQERFNVSYSRADALVRTEIAHIQTQAAIQRYEDYGIGEVEIWADKDERRCDICGKLHQKRYSVGAQVPIPAHPRCRCCVVPVVDDTKPQTQPIAEDDKKKDAVYQAQIKARREAYKQRTEKPKQIRLDGMSKKDVIAWSKKNIKTSVDYTGASEEAVKKVAKTLYEIEQQGFDLEDIKVVFGGTNGNYGTYIPKTKTIHLRTNDNFALQRAKEDERALRKLGRKQHAVAGYEGVMLHEIGHALDDLTKQAVSKAIAHSPSLFGQAVKISNYAGTSGAIGTNRASETFAEQFSAYMTESEREKVPKEIQELIEKYLRKNKLK